MPDFDSLAVYLRGMRTNKNKYLNAPILGGMLSPGQTILVGDASLESVVHRYIFGNCILEGTRGTAPIACFVPGADLTKISNLIKGMAAGESVFPQLYFDNTPHLTVPYLLARICHLVEAFGIKMVVIDTLHDIDARIFQDETEIQDISSLASLLTGIARAFGLVVLVTAGICPRIPERLFDQMMQFKVVDAARDRYQILLPKGYFPLRDEYGEQMLNVVLDWGKGYFKPADCCFDEEDDLPSEIPPKYQWCKDPVPPEAGCHFDFLDAEGGEWTLRVTPEPDAFCGYEIVSENGEECIRFMGYGRFADIDAAKKFALQRVREQFPGVEIPERT